ncbi:MAG: coniferyl-alcohol dehydrogenase [Myxococcota bacterium]|nr:coniferyl-alcohol dehydrogenase [Myxococcota bacterium]
MRDLFSYAGKRAVVVGCYSGMGEATARLVGEMGAEVVAVDIREPEIPHSDFLEIDCRDPGSIDSGIDTIVSQGPIDALFYCAGLPGGSFSNADVMSVNFLGQRRFIERCAGHMEQGSAIASISSGAGMAYMMALDRVKEFLAIEDYATALEWVSHEDEAGRIEGYSFSKMCTIVYVLNRGPVLTRETGIRLNCISPGPTDTPMMPHFEKQVGKEFMDAFPKPIGRNSTAEEQAWPLAFLNSPAASYISGENLFTDGGCSGGIMTGSIDPSAMGSD